MTPIKPPQVAHPLSSEELEHDAIQAGVAADETTHEGGDTHLPSSETDALAGSDRRLPNIEQSVAEMPPG